VTIYINLPATGFVSIPDKFKKILDLKEVQRLRRIKQLSGVEYVFPGATHTRFEHSVGVFTNVQKMLSIFLENNNDLSENIIDSALLAGLLHDIGHGPFSHNFEDILQTNIKKSHEDFTKEIILKSEVGDFIEDLGIKKEDVANLAVGKLNKKELRFLDQMISGAIDCDQMDYLVRDAYHCGTNSYYETVERIFQIANIYENSKFEKILAYHIKGIATIETFLFSRLNAFRTIYFHKTSRAIQLMLKEAMMRYNDTYKSFNFNLFEEYLKWDDFKLYNALKNDESTSNIIDRIERRDLIKLAYEKPPELNKTEEELKHYNPNKLKEEIANKAKINVEKIFIDFPKTKSVPYQTSSKLMNDEIYVYSKTSNNEIELKNIENCSLFLPQIQGFFRLIRIYTEKEYINQVANAAKKILIGVTLDDFMSI